MALDISSIKTHNPKTTNKASIESNAFWKKDFSFSKVLTDKRKEEFYTELVILSKSGLDFKTSLDIYIREQKKPEVKKIFETIGDRIVHGASFSDSIENIKGFTPYEYFSVRIGEESGRLTDVLEELASYYRKRMKQRKQLISAFSYPALIFATAFGAVFFMLNFIVPLFADAFKRFNSELPALTKTVIAFSGFFRVYWFTIPLFVVLIVIAYRTFKNEQWFRKHEAFVLLHSPIIGPLIQKIYLARFCQSMALMTSARTPLIQSLDLVSKMMKLYPFEVALKQITDDLYHGKLLNESMAKFPVFESRMVSLIKVGEETNHLEGIFKRLYEQYSDDVDHQTAIMSSMLEPLLIILIGGLVAVILVAMYLPMFKLGSSLMGT